MSLTQQQMGTVLSAFQCANVAELVANLETTLTEARARALGPLGVLVMTAPDDALTLLGAALPLRLDLVALRRCCDIAWSGDAGVEHFASITN